MADLHDHLIDLEHVARLLGLSPRTVRRMCSNGTGPRRVALPCRRIRFHRDEIDRWIGQQQDHADGPTS